MKKLWLFGGAALGIALAAPLIAHDGMDMKMGHDMTMKRADVEPKIKELFARIDANADGAITHEEVDAAREKRRAEMRAHMFDRLDANKDGSISRDEFNAAPPRGGHDGMRRHGPDAAAGGPGHDHSAPPPAGRPEAAGGPRHGMMGGMGHMADRMFDTADANKDGKVTLAETTKAALAHFDAVDTNKDGQVTPDERHAFHQKMRAE